MQLLPSHLKSYLLNEASKLIIQQKKALFDAVHLELLFCTRSICKDLERSYYYQYFYVWFDPDGISFSLPGYSGRLYSFAGESSTHWIIIYEDFKLDYRYRHTSPYW